MGVHGPVPVGQSVRSEILESVLGQLGESFLPHLLEKKAAEYNGDLERLIHNQLQSSKVTEWRLGKATNYNSQQTVI